MNYFCCLLSSIRYGSWCVGFILSLAVSILSRFFVVFFPPFFLSFLRRILAMSSCCCCDFWDCLGGVRNLLSSVSFRCWIILLRNFFWFCASITSLRYFLFCFCLVFVFVFSPSLILFGSWQAASALLVCASLTSLLFFFFSPPLSFSCSFRILASTGFVCHIAVSFFLFLCALLSGTSDFFPKLVSHIARWRFFSITAIHRRRLLSATLFFFFCVALSLECCSCALVCPFLSTPTLKRMNTIPSFQYFLSLAGVYFYSVTTTTTPPAHE